MIGIGGISMSGIAEILKFWGFHVTGSDSTSSETTEKLIENGIHVTIGHDLENLAKADVVVYSAAISKEDIEYKESKRIEELHLVAPTKYMKYMQDKINELVKVSNKYARLLEKVDGE